MSFKEEFKESPSKVIFTIFYGLFAIGYVAFVIWFGVQANKNHIETQKLIKEMRNEK